MEDHGGSTGDPSNPPPIPLGDPINGSHNIPTTDFSQQAASDRNNNSESPNDMDLDDTEISFFTISFTVPPRHQHDGKFNCPAIIRSIHEIVKKADPSLVLCKPITVIGRPPTGPYINDPSKLPTNETVFKEYFPTITVLKRTRSLYGQIAIGTKLSEFPKIKYHPAVFLWLKQQNIFLKVNSLSMFQVQSAGVFIHAIPNESRSFHFEEGIKRLVGRPIPKFHYLLSICFTKKNGFEYSKFSLRKMMLLVYKKNSTTLLRSHQTTTQKTN